MCAIVVFLVILLLVLFIPATYMMGIHRGLRIARRRAAVQAQAAAASAVQAAAASTAAASNASNSAGAVATPAS